MEDDDSAENLRGMNKAGGTIFTVPPAFAILSPLLIF